METIDEREDEEYVTSDFNEETPGLIPTMK